MNPGMTSTDSFLSRPRLQISESPLPLGRADQELANVTASEVKDGQQWLSFHRVWGQLPTAALQAIAEAMQGFRVTPQTPIYQEGQTPAGLYLLKWGTVEIYRQSTSGNLLIQYRNAGDLFGYALAANPAEDCYQTSAIAITASEIWFLPQAAFQSLIVTYPAIQQVMQTLLSQDLDAYAARIA